MKDKLKGEILKDFDRAKKALASAKRNFEEEDILTAANRVFVACENTVYVYMKLKFGSTTISRKRIILKLESIDPLFKELYERSYDLRVQADYGRKSRIAQLNKKNVKNIIRKVEKRLSEAETRLKNVDIF